MARILVTGGAGFIGSHIVDALVERKNRILVVDTLTSGSRRNINPAADFVRLDIRSRKLQSLCTQFRPEAVMHCAAQMNIPLSLEKPSFDAEVNIQGTLNLLSAAKKVGTRRVVFASSAAVYGATKKLPIAESHPALPSSPYGISKYAAERYLEFFSKSPDFSGLNLRFANVYGPRQGAQGEAGVIAIFLRRLINGQDLPIFGTGRQTRDFVFVADIVRACVAALKSRQTGTLNIGTGRETSILTVAKILLRLSRQPASICHLRPRREDVPRNSLESRAAQRELRWSPRVSIAEGLRLTWEAASQERGI